MTIEIDPSLIKNMAQNERRIDNRKFNEYRNIVIEPNVITSAEGSCRVRIGNTEVIAGIKMDVGEPFPDTPNEGVLMVASEFVPLASPDFESGPPREGSIEVSRIVDRTIRESKAIDFGKLCLKEGEKVWMLFIDIDVIDNDGNLIDAASIASLVALMITKIPELDENQKPIYEKKGSQPLPMNGMPVATTFAKINGELMADPCLLEEKSLDARLTVGTVDKDGKTMFCAMQKGGSHGINIKEIEQILDMAIEKGDAIRRMVKEFV